MLWFPLSLSAAFFWSISQIFLKKGLENIPPLWSNIINNFMTIVIWIPVIFIFNKSPIIIPNFKMIMLIAITSSLYLIFLYALSKGKVALVGTVVSIYPLWTIILSHFILSEAINSIQKICILLIITGSVIISLPEKFSNLKKYNYQWIVWGFAASILIGTGDFLSKFAITKIGVYNYTFYLSISYNFMSILNYLMDKKSRKLPSRNYKKYISTIVGAAISLTGSFLFLLAFNFGKASLVTPVSSIYPALTVILAMKFLKEKLIKRQLAAVGLTVVGLILMGISIT